MLFWRNKQRHQETPESLEFSKDKIKKFLRFIEKENPTLRSLERSLT